MLTLPKAVIAASLSSMLLVCGCLPQAASCRVVAPLKEQGEVIVFFEGWSAKARRLDLMIESVALERAGGEVVSLGPLEIKGATMTRPRALVRSPIAPGNFVALQLKVKRVALRATGEPSNLLLTGQPLRVPLSFAVRRRQSALLYLAPSQSTMVDGVTFRPDFRGRLARQRPVEDYGYCTDSGTHTVSVFATPTHRLVSVIHTGQNPRGLAIDRAGRRLYLALSGEDQVDVLDAGSGSSLQRISLQPGDLPEDLVLTSDGKTLITVNRGSNTASFIDVGAGQEAKRVSTGQEPTRIALGRNEQWAFVSNASNSVTVVDVRNRSVLATLTTEVRPLRAQFDRRGTRLFIAHQGSAYVMVYRLPELTLLDRVFVGMGNSAIIADPNTDLIYVATDEGRRLRVLAAESLVPIEAIDLPQPVSEMTINGFNNTLLLLSAKQKMVSVMDLTNRKIVGEFDVGCAPYMVKAFGQRR